MFYRTSTILLYPDTRIEDQTPYVTKQEESHVASTAVSIFVPEYLSPAMLFFFVFSRQVGSTIITFPWSTFFVLRETIRPSIVRSHTLLYKYATSAMRGQTKELIPVWRIMKYGAGRVLMK